MADLATTAFWLGALAAVAAGSIRGFSGFGAALTLAPPLSLLYGPATAVPIVMVLEFIVGLELLIGLAWLVRWRDIAFMAVPAILAVPAGGVILLVGDADVMRRIIGAIVIMVATILLWGWRYHGRPRPVLTLGVGALSGFLNGSTGLAGPPVVLYQVAGPDSAEVTRAQLTAFFTIVDGAGLLFFLAAGAIDLRQMELTGLLALPFLASALLGKHVGRFVGDAPYRRFVLLFLLAIGVGTLLA